MTYTESLEYLNDLAKFGIKPGLDRIISLLNRLDNPQNKYKTIHITGTNGKGSVTNMLASILSVSGCSTGAFTSPHLFRYNERMTINGGEISDEDFAGIATIVRGYVEAMLDDSEECPTQFEFLTAMAFFYFARKSVDYAVIRSRPWRTSGFNECCSTRNSSYNQCYAGTRRQMRRNIRRSSAP